MRTDNWESILAKFKIDGGQIKPVPAESISKFEKDKGLILPRTYHSFCDTFGPGILTRPWSYRIYVPKAKNKYYDIDYFNEMVKGQEDAADLPDVNQFNRSLFFASDIATSHYFWDPEDCTDRSNSEYGVYVLYREWKVERLSDTFWSFINDVCLGTGIPAYNNTTLLNMIFNPGE